MGKLAISRQTRGFQKPESIDYSIVFSYLSPFTFETFPSPHLHLRQPIFARARCAKKCQRRLAGRMCVPIPIRSAKPAADFGYHSSLQRFSSVQSLSLTHLLPCLCSCCRVVGEQTLLFSSRHSFRNFKSSFFLVTATNCLRPSHHILGSQIIGLTLKA